MLPVEFLPDVDELPVSWMNRLALANSFIDVWYYVKKKDS